jgi:transcription elongation factor Elf1
MARQMREVLVCDVCGSEREVTVVAVTMDGAEQTVELCAEHRLALQEAVASILPGFPSLPPAPGPEQQPGAAPRKAATRTRRKRAERQQTSKRKETCPHCGLEMSVQNLGRHIAAKHPGSE